MGSKSRRPPHRRNRESRQQHRAEFLTTQDKQQGDALTKLLAQSQTWQVPALAWQRGGEFLDQRDLR